MKRLRAWFGSGLLFTSALAADPEAPSIELLLYLAEWGADADGQLVDPLDLPDSAEPSPEAPDGNPGLPVSSKPEYPR